MLGCTVSIHQLSTRCFATRPQATKSASQRAAGEAAKCKTPVAEAEGLQLHLSSKSATGYKGVRQDAGVLSGGGYRAGHMVGGISRHIGTFDTAVEAAVAYARAVVKAKAEAEEVAAEEGKEEEEEEEEAPSPPDAKSSPDDFARFTSGARSGLTPPSAPSSGVAAALLGEGEDLDELLPPSLQVAALCLQQAALPRLHLGSTSAPPRLYLGSTSAPPRP